MAYLQNNELTVIVIPTVLAVVAMFATNRKNTAYAAYGVAYACFSVLLHELVSKLLN